MIKTVKLEVEHKVQYIGFKEKDSIKYARVECYKKVKVGKGDVEFVLEKTIAIIATDFNLSKLKYDLIKIHKILEWNEWGKI